MRYLLCTQHAWGAQVFNRVYAQRGADEWAMLCCETGDGYDLAAHLGALPHVDKTFFVHWSDLVSPNVLAQTECVNFHCTPLPYGRGGHPIENMILRGYTETIMTAHRMVEQVDAGAIYAQIGPISLAGTKVEILDRFIWPVTQLIMQIVVGQPVIPAFKRLAPRDYDAFWASR